MKVDDTINIKTDWYEMSECFVFWAICEPNNNPEVLELFQIRELHIVIKKTRKREIKRVKLNFFQAQSLVDLHKKYSTKNTHIEYPLYVNFINNINKQLV